MTDAIVTVNGLVDGWYDVTCEYGTEGYIRSDFLDLTESSAPPTATSSAHRQAVPGHGLCVRRRLSPAALTAPASPCTCTASTATPCPTPPPASGRAASAPRYGRYLRCSAARRSWCSSTIPAATPARHAPMPVSTRETGSSSTPPLPAAAASSSASLTSGYYNTYFVGGIHV